MVAPSASIYSWCTARAATTFEAEHNSHEREVDAFMDQAACIVAPTDFSPAADRATRRAAALASALVKPLYVVHVLPPWELLQKVFPGPAASATDALRSKAERALQERAQRVAERFGIAPQCKVVYGEAHQAILDTSHSLEAELIVLGAQGESEGVLPTETVGDTALKLAERSLSATLLVRREVQESYCDVVACAKGVPADRAVVEWANRVSPADLIHIVSAYAVPFERRLIEWGAAQKTLDTYATREREERTQKLSGLLSEFGVPAARARLHMERGDPLPTILRTAAQWQADLLVVGRRAQANPLSAGQFASIARHIAFRASMDVMIVPPPGTA